MKKNNIILLISILSLFLSLVTLLFYDDSSNALVKNILYYLCSIILVLSSCMLYLLIRKHKLQIFISYSEENEDVYRELKKQLEKDCIGGAIHIAIRSSKNDRTIDNCSYAFVILSRRITGKQKYEIKKLTDLHKNIVVVLVGDNISIPNNLNPVKTILYTEKYNKTKIE